MVHRKFDVKEIALGAAFILLLLVLVTFYIWYQTEAVQLGYRIGELESRVANLKEDIKKLEARKASLLSLRRVEGIARDRLGLADPAPGQILFDDGAGEAKKGS
jgi:cell division protein FtsL